MSKSKRFAQILCIVLAASMVLTFFLAVAVEWPWIIIVIAAAAIGGYLYYRFKGKGANRRK